MESGSQLYSISPKSITVLCIVLGLFSMAFALIFSKPLIFAVIVCLPLVLIILNYSLQFPRFSYFIYGTYIYYLTAIMRYSRTEGLSVISDSLLVYIFLSILFCAVSNRKSIRLTNAVNFLTISYSIWILYILIQFTNPASDGESYLVGIRNWCLAIPMLYIVSSILLDNPKTLKVSLIIIGIFTFTAFLKLMYQRFRWFDAYEAEWLMTGSWYTHILAWGIRYFSIFSDAGNFGANMGMITTIYGIITFCTSNRWLRLFYFSVTLMGITGMMLSGTRGAVVVPLGGLALFCLLSKNIKTIAFSGFTLVLMFVFFNYTNIGEDNRLIQRMRTAFTPTEDASFNVRVENQKKINAYLESHPWGAGLGKGIERVQYINGEFVVDNIPPDSFYVNIWMQTGYTGLILYIFIYAAILLKCCYIIMFKVRNQELRLTLAALLGGTFGIWLNGYVGRSMEMTPSNFMIAASLAFIMNGAYIDRQLQSVKENTNNDKQINKLQ